MGIRESKHQGSQLLESREIERVSPSQIRFRRRDAQGNILEDRPASFQEVQALENEERDDARLAAREQFIASLGDVTIPAKVREALRNLAKSMGMIPPL